MTLIIAAAQSMSVPCDPLQNVARHLQFGTIAAECGAQVLIFPELSLTGYELAKARANAIRPNATCLAPLRRLAEKAHMTVVTGAPVLNEKEELHIAAITIRADASVLLHTKQYLHTGEEAEFTPGLGGPVLQIEDTRIALAICADTAHPHHAASAAARGANVYAASVLITARGYERDTALLRQYAIQHKMAVANYSGDTGGLASAGKSTIWSEDGTVVAASMGTEEALVVGRRAIGMWDGSVLPLL